jgi:double-strand break repair protein MRE11
VHHAGFPTINQQRFGTQFVGDVANPSDIILYSKKSKDGTEATGASGAGSRGYRSEFDNLSLNGDVDSMSQIRVEDLVQEALGSQNKQLGLLSAGMIDVFVSLMGLMACSLNCK